MNQIVSRVLGSGRLSTEDCWNGLKKLLGRSTRKGSQGPENQVIRENKFYDTFGERLLTISVRDPTTHGPYLYTLALRCKESDQGAEDRVDKPFFDDSLRVLSEREVLW